LESAETKCKQAEQDELDAREKETFLKTEIDVLKDKLKQMSLEQQESYKREERTQRNNQTVKNQLDQSKKELERTTL
jgi:FtsZ-binding cell division protein ZapB